MRSFLHAGQDVFRIEFIEAGFGTVNATGANFRRIIDLSDRDRSVATNAPVQSAQPGSPFYDNLIDYLGNGEYFPYLFSREAVEGAVAHRMTLRPGGGSFLRSVGLARR